MLRRSRTLSAGNRQGGNGPGLASGRLSTVQDSEAPRPETEASRSQRRLTNVQLVCYSLIHFLLGCPSVSCDAIGLGNIFGLKLVPVSRLGNSARH